MSSPTRIAFNAWIKQPFGVIAAAYLLLLTLFALSQMDLVNP